MTVEPRYSCRAPQERPHSSCNGVTTLRLRGTPQARMFSREKGDSVPASGKTSSLRSKMGSDLCKREVNDGAQGTLQQAHVEGRGRRVRKVRENECDPFPWSEPRARGTLAPWSLRPGEPLGVRAHGPMASARRVPIRLQLKGHRGGAPSKLRTGGGGCCCPAQGAGGGGALSAGVTLREGKPHRPCQPGPSAPPPGPGCTLC